MKEDLWTAWKEHGDQDARSALIEQHAPLVRYVAGRMAHRVPPAVERDDLTSDGYFGLIDAVDKFDPGRGVRFEAYAVQRIQGAILDGLRSSDWVPRSVRSKAREIEKTWQELGKRLDREPTIEEIASHIGMAATDVSVILHDVDAANNASLTTDISSESTLADFQVDNSQDKQLDLEVEELMWLVSRRLADLPDRERAIAVLYYFHEMTPTEIGKILGVSESRVCQLQPHVIQRLCA